MMLYVHLYWSNVKVCWTKKYQEIDNYPFQNQTFTDAPSVDATLMNRNV